MNFETLKVSESGERAPAESTEKTPIETGRERFEEIKPTYEKYLDGAESFDQLTLVIRMNSVEVDGENILFGEGENGSLDRAIDIVNQMSKTDSLERVSTLWDEGLPGQKLRDKIKELLLKKLDAEKTENTH